MSKIPQIFHRFSNNPIIKPSDYPWCNRSVFNAAAIKYGDNIQLIYRAVGTDGTSALGVATSPDGYNFKILEKPVISKDPEDKFEARGLEDPRITYLDGKYYITYVAASLYPDGHPCPVWSPDMPWCIRIAACSTTDFKTYKKMGVILPEIESKDPALFPERINNEVYLLHRNFPDIWLASGDFNCWRRNEIIMKPREGYWDDNRIGASPPPIKTKEGWLLIYHGVDNKLIYRQGVALLDLKDPYKVIARSPMPFLEPQEDYELDIIPGNNAIAVFSCGVIQEGDDLIMYYGASDKYLCGGRVKIPDLMNILEPVK